MKFFHVLKRVAFFRPETKTSEDSDSSPPYLPAQPSAPEEQEPMDHHHHHVVQAYTRDVAV